MTAEHRLCRDRAEADAAVRDLVSSGWRLAREFRLPETPWDLSGARVVAAGLVADSAGAQSALLAAVRGCSLVLTLPDGVDWQRAYARALAADLGRLRRQRTVDAATPAESLLTHEQRAVLELLVRGESIAAAARLLFLSLRTTNRRVAEARAALGVRTTREAVFAYAELSGRPSGLV